MNRSISLETAEAKLINAISGLIWIIPGITLIEIIISLYLEQPIEWMSLTFYDIFTWMLIFVLISKGLTIVDRQLNLERDYREKKFKLGKSAKITK